MNRVRIFTVFLIAIIAGGGLAYVTYDYMKNAPVKTVNMATKRAQEHGVPGPDDVVAEEEMLVG